MNIAQPKLTLVFDIDGVICEIGSFVDYSQAVPYPHGIAQVNECYERGYYIVLQTARGMRSFHGDIVRCYYELYDVTFQWLIRHGVKFHKLHFGKQSGNLYVDDRGCRVDSALGMTQWDDNFWPLLQQVEQSMKRGM